jgi:methylmalonyl-CoA/ethylmalonyl-CoA epimerase
MFKKISHIGIAVKNLDRAIKNFSNLIGSPVYKIERIDEQKIRVAMFKIGESRIELIEPTSPDSPVAKFIEKRGEGIHHIAFEVDNIKSELERLKKLDIQLINLEPEQGADNCLVAFIHPKSLNGVLAEITELIK